MKFKQTRLRVRKHARDRFHISLEHASRAPQMPLVFGGFLGQDVALKGLTALNGAARTHEETLGRALLRLHFWHDISYFYIASKAGFDEPTFQSPDAT
jgi:hypothetical protein